MVGENNLLKGVKLRHFYRDLVEEGKQAQELKLIKPFNSKLQEGSKAKRDFLSGLHAMQELSKKEYVNQLMPFGYIPDSETMMELTRDISGNDFKPVSDTCEQVIRQIVKSITNFMNIFIETGMTVDFGDRADHNRLESDDGIRISHLYDSDNELSTKAFALEDKENDIEIQLSIEPKRSLLHITYDRHKDRGLGTFSFRVPHDTHDRVLANENGEYRTFFYS